MGIASPAITMPDWVIYSLVFRRISGGCQAARFVAPGTIRTALPW